jgi:hypothetical protein
MTDGMRVYQAGNLGNNAIVQQGEHLSMQPRSSADGLY